MNVKSMEIDFSSFNESFMNVQNKEKNDWKLMDNITTGGGGITYSSLYHQHQQDAQ